jgi:hypothetical protein
MHGEKSITLFDSTFALVSKNGSHHEAQRSRFRQAPYAKALPTMLIFGVKIRSLCFVHAVQSGRATPFMKKLTILILPALLSAACNLPRSEKVDYKVYEDETTGWITRYPSDWKEMTKKEIDELEGRGQKLLESAINEQFTLSHRNLLWLKKDAFNSFTSNTQAYDSVEDGPYNEIQEFVFHTILEAYDTQAIPYDVTFGNEVIDGIAFSTMQITIYAPERKKTIMSQIMYDALIAPSRSLTININFNNEKDKKILHDIIDESKFPKKK